MQRTRAKSPSRRFFSFALRRLTRRAAALASRSAMAQAGGDVDISLVCALTNAARKQARLQHYARAEELYERAIVAAEALRQPDCLIVARCAVGS